MQAAITIGSTLEKTAAPGLVGCAHCGTACPDGAFAGGGRAFCCQGCRTVFELLHEHGLGQFYELNEAAGRRVAPASGADKYRYLDAPGVRERFVDFADGTSTRVTFHLPAIHCVACVWLLENLFRLKAGLGRVAVNFARREAAITFQDAQVRLSEVAALLESIGYEPDLKLADLEQKGPARVSRRLWLQLGVAGFAFGNTMLFSLPGYFGLDSASGPAFRTLVGWLSLGLGIPVALFSAADYWRTSWVSLRQRRLTIDVPIALGIAALFLQSAYEVTSGRGEGYFDSLAGLLFFLLCGKIFQQKTYDRLAFDRDYKAFFPLSVLRLRHREDGRNRSDFALRTPHSALEERVSLAQLSVGDRILLRHGELIPADARLLSGAAAIDYSFVTGEAEPVLRQPGEHLYAGGRQLGGSIVIETVKPVSQSYLASLWDQAAFRKEKDDTFNSLTNRYSRRFTVIVLGIALAAALFWAFREPGRAVTAFVGVLIVACPCALALAAPFTLGAALRVLGRRDIFLRNAEVIEALARVDTVVFDKTGTLTAAEAGEVKFTAATEGPRSRVQGPRSERGLDNEEAGWIAALAEQSTHPLAATLCRWLKPQTGPEPVAAVEHFTETPGAGVEGSVSGQRLALGSAAFVGQRASQLPAAPSALPGSVVHVAINGRYRGHFTVTSAVRPDTGRLLTELAGRHELALLSGDHERDAARFRKLLGERAQLRFHQSPHDKLDFVRARQQAGRQVLMVGDGLNDAGALRQADVGVAVVERIGAFSPASDVIMDAALVPRLGDLLDYSRRTVRLVRAGFVISALYNVVGVGIAASGRLSPIICAVLMPLSSITVVAFATGAALWLGRRLPGRNPAPGSPSPVQFMAKKEKPA